MTPRWQIERMIAARVVRHNAERERRNALWIVDASGIVHIPLPSGNVALIDQRHTENAKRYVWNVHKARRSKTFYAKAHIPGAKPRKEIFLHNLVMEGCGQVDHKDGDGLNCVDSNLRPATASQNASNRKSRSLKQPYRGVFMYPSGRWAAHIKYQQKPQHLGTFDTPEQAAIAYNEAALAKFGEFAVLNEIRAA